MGRTRPFKASALILVGLLTAGSLTTLTAACAHAQAAFAFEQVPRHTETHSSHRAAYLCALAGAGLIAASFPIADEADRRYGRYLSEADPLRFDDRFRSATHMDRLASASLLTGEGLLAAAVYLRFVRRTDSARVRIALEPTACAVSWRF